MLCRIVQGAQVPLLVAVTSVAVSMTAGTALGLPAGWYRGRVEAVVMRTADAVLPIPALLLAILAVVVLEPGLTRLVLGFTRRTRHARVAHGQTLAMAGRPFVAAARFHGAGALWLLPGTS